MSHEHPSAATFLFDQDRHVRVFLCAHVAAGVPVLYVSHDADGDWQFLCGRMHDPELGDKPVVQCLEHVVARDPSLNELSALRTNHHAERASEDSAWVVTDETEGFIKSAVHRHGWAVQLIPEGTEAEPAFAYTVGLFKTFGQPELIVFGLQREAMHAMLNDLGARARDGAQNRPGAAASGILDGYDVRLRQVSSPESYRQHVGYAIWFYGAASFPLLQVVWPDENGRFPGEPGAADFLEQVQPLLP